MEVGGAGSADQLWGYRRRGAEGTLTGTPMGDREFHPWGTPAGRVNPLDRRPAPRLDRQGRSERAMSSAVKRSAVMVLLGLLAVGATYWGWGYLPT